MSDGYKPGARVVASLGVVQLPPKPGKSSPKVNPELLEPCAHQHWAQALTRVQRPSILCPAIASIPR